MEKKNYILETAQEARIEALGLGDKINTVLKENGYSAVADLFLEFYNELFPEEIVRKIKFERDAFMERIQDFLDATIDPENCIYGTFYQYYNVVLFLEKYLEGDYKTPMDKRIKINSLGKNTFSVQGLNNIFSTVTRRNILMLHMKATDKMSYNDISAIYDMNSTHCRCCVKLLLEKIKACIDEIFVFSQQEQVVEVASQENTVFIDFLGLNTRYVNALKMKKINTLEELKNVAKAGELINIRNIGKKGYNEIIKVLEHYS